MECARASKHSTEIMPKIFVARPGSKVKMSPATIPTLPPTLRDEITNAVSETEQRFFEDVSTTMKNFKDELQVEGLAR